MMLGKKNHKNIQNCVPHGGSIVIYHGRKWKTTLKKRKKTGFMQIGSSKMAIVVVSQFIISNETTTTHSFFFQWTSVPEKTCGVKETQFFNVNRKSSNGPKRSRIRLQKQTFCFSGRKFTFTTRASLSKPLLYRIETPTKVVASFFLLLIFWQQRCWKFVNFLSDWPTIATCYEGIIRVKSYPSCDHHFCKQNLDNAFHWILV